MNENNATEWISQYKKHHNFISNPYLYKISSCIWVHSSQFVMIIARNHFLIYIFILFSFPVNYTIIVLWFQYRMSFRLKFIIYYLCILNAAHCLIVRKITVNCLLINICCVYLIIVIWCWTCLMCHKILIGTRYIFHLNIVILLLPITTKIN